MKIAGAKYIAIAAILALCIGCDSDSSSDDSVDEQRPPAVEDLEASPPPSAGEAQTELVMQARELAELRKRIEANPERLDELLADAGLTEQELETLLFEISADPAASEAFAEAR